MRGSTPVTGFDESCSVLVREIPETFDPECERGLIAWQDVETARLPLVQSEPTRSFGQDVLEQGEEVAL